MTQKTQKKGFSLEKLTQNTVFLSVISLILSLLVAGLVMMIAGYSPIEGYSAMFTGAFGSVDAGSATGSIRTDSPRTTRNATGVMLTPAPAPISVSKARSSRARCLRRWSARIAAACRGLSTFRCALSRA